MEVAGVLDAVAGVERVGRAEWKRDFGAEMGTLVDGGDQAESFAAFFAVNEEFLLPSDSREEVRNLTVMALIGEVREFIVEGLDFSGQACGVVFRETVFFLFGGLDLPGNREFGALALKSKLLLLTVMDQGGGNLADAAVGVG